MHVVTGNRSIATAVEAMRLGAHDYLSKPAHADQILASFETESGGDIAEPTYEVPSLAKLEREHIERVLQETTARFASTTWSMESSPVT